MMNTVNISTLGIFYLRSFFSQTQKHWKTGGKCIYKGLTP